MRADDSLDVAERELLDLHEGGCRLAHDGARAVENDKALAAELPPLWPIAFVLTLYLLFPKTISRIGVVATVFLLLSSLVVTGILILLLVGLFNVVF